MSAARPPSAGTVWLRAPTLRLRLTLLFGALVLVAGAALLTLDYALVSRGLAASQQPIPLRFQDQFGDPVTVQVSPQGGLAGTTLGEAIREAQQQIQEEALHTLLRQSLFALVLVSATGFAVAHVAAGRVLRPLQQITATARRLSTDTLDERIELTGPADELKELADTFDDMLSRLDAAFESQRRFVANASHELRTPLAVMRTEVDVALADADASVEDLRAMGSVVRAATERADRLVDSLLLLARSDRGLERRESVNLATVAAAALDGVRAEGAARRLRVDTAYGDVPPLCGDPDLLERLAGNLVENAVRHNVDDGWLSARTSTHDGQARLEVANSGLPIPAEEVAGLFEPFRRLGAARTASRGAGLGLSIVRSVAAAHGGTVAAHARADGGLTVTVDLPTQDSGGGSRG